MSLPERLASLTTRDESSSLLGRRDKDGDPSASSLMQKCIIIQRDEKGYGFTVSGDNPVFVALVKQDGAAARAGVQNGDRIVKVNGTLVTQRNHLDVVKLIKSGSYVALTLLSKPSPSASSGTVNHPSRDSMVGRVTAPQPVDPDKDRELRQQKLHMTRAMYETAKEDFEKMQKQFVSRPSEKLHGQLLEMERTVKALDHKLRELTAEDEPVMTVVSPLPTAATFDMGSISDSSQTSPSVSPTPDEHNSRQNGQNLEYLLGQSEIIHPDYEEDNSDDDQVSDPGPFADMKLLENKPAHLAVFLNYLISNNDPSPVLFHIISDLYNRSAGSNKELRKWAYEIYSTFIFKFTPLSIDVEDNIISQIDNILATSGSRTDNENVLRGMFQAARQSVQMEISELLTDFRMKKELGMGNLYGIQKIQDNMDRSAEVRIAEELLLPLLKCFGAEDNSGGNMMDKDLAIGWALATYLRSLGVPKLSHNAVLERVQTFMMKDKKSIRLPGSRSGRAKAWKGHQLNLQHFYMTTFCTFCGNLIWGVGYQGYQCQNCEIILHKLCAEEITESCGGKQKRRRLPLSVVIPNRRLSSNNPGQPQQQPYPAVDQTCQASTPGHIPPYADITTQPYPKEEDSELAGLSSGHSVHEMVSRFQGLVSPIGSSQGSLGVPLQQETVDSMISETSERTRRGSSNLNRSGSLTNKGKKNERPARRAKSDVDVDSEIFKEINQSASSSASSLSNRSVESPGNSTDNVNDLLRAQYDDPDMDVESELPPLKQFVPEEILRKLKPKEKKRQEVINELFYTERAHLRNLKVLDLLFHRPMYQEKGIISELASALFPYMEEIISLHESFVKDIKERSQSVPPIRDVGDLLLKRFDGEAGERFRKGCAEYCRNQAYALDALKKHTRKEPKLQQFLHDAESNALCRRLQLKDLLPSEMQRLTKYPLLIDNLLKYTQAQSEEHRRLERAQEKCKHILAYVNQAMKECENYHKLKDFQRKLDRRSLEGMNDPAVAELKSLDLTQHKLTFDSPLTWKLRSHRTVDLQVLLLEDLLVLLQKQDDKYVLKCQNTNVQPTRDDKYTHFPVLKLQNLLARTLATEKKSFFVVNISESRAQMYEFTAASSDLRLKWCKLINEKADELKMKSNQPYSSQLSQAQQAALGRHNRLSKITENSSGPISYPASQDIFEVTDQLSRRLDIGDDSHSEMELILPEEVSISDAVITEPSSDSFPQATLSPEVSSHEIQPPPQLIHQPPQLLHQPPQLLHQPSLSSPVNMGQLKNMATEMNEILAKLAGAINIQGNDEKQRMRLEIQKAQLQLDSLKQMKKQITEADVSPSGRASPSVPVLSDIPPTSCTSNMSTLTCTSATADEALQQKQDGLMTTASSNVPQWEAEMLKQKYGLENSTEDDVLLTPSLEVSTVQLQEAVVSQLEESVEHLHLCTEVVPVITMETETSESGMMHCDEVSVTDLPLPDPVSISCDDLVSEQHLQDDGGYSEIENDDLVMFNYQNMTSSTTTVEDMNEQQMVSDTFCESSSSVLDTDTNITDDGAALRGPDEGGSSWTDA